MTTEPQKRPPGRPRTGRTPDPVRQANSLAELRRNGGDKIAARLPAESMEHLRTVKGKLGGTAGTTEAVIAALEFAAKRMR